MSCVLCLVSDVCRLMSVVYCLNLKANKYYHLRNCPLWQRGRAKRRGYVLPNFLKKKPLWSTSPFSVKRYFYNLPFGLSGIVISRRDIAWTTTTKPVRELITETTARNVKKAPRKSGRFYYIILRITEVEIFKTSIFWYLFKNYDYPQCVLKTFINYHEF